jgi:cytochrome P450
VNGPSARARPHTTMVELDSIDIRDPETYAQQVPHALFAKLRREDPVHWHLEPDGGPGFWAVTRHSEIAFVHRHPDLFSSARGHVFLEDLTEEQRVARQSMIETDAPYHTKLRRIVAPYFTPRGIRGHEGRVRELTGRLLDAALHKQREEGSFDWVDDFAALLPIRVLLTILGPPEEDAAQLLELSNALLADSEPDFARDFLKPIPGIPNEMLPFNSPAAHHIFEYARKLGAARREQPVDDLVSKLVHAEVDGDSLTEPEFCNFFQLLLFAGNETTRTSLAHGLGAFIANPEQLDLLALQPELMPSAIEEVLRWASPILYFRRTATEDVELDDKTIREGDKVATWFISGNYDESVFPEPLKFDVAREPRGHVAFGGGGPHFCLGASLARLENEVVWSELLARGLRFELAGPVQRIRSNFVNGIKRMPVRAVAGLGS